jgi:hypothetical protein
MEGNLKTVGYTVQCSSLDKAKTLVREVQDRFGQCIVELEGGKEFFAISVNAEDGNCLVFFKTKEIDPATTIALNNLVKKLRV